MRARLLGVMLCCVLASQLFANAADAEDRPFGEPGTYLVEVATGQTIVLGSGAQAAWSPDSKTVAVAEIGAESAVARLRLVPVPDGAPRDLEIPERGEINHLRWAPDGSGVAFTLTRMGRDPGPALMVADAATGDVRRLVRGSIGEIAWTPDSQAIAAITLDEGGGSVVIIDAGNGEVRETVPGVKDASCQRGLAWSPDGAYLAFGGPGLREGCGDVGNWGVWTWHPASKQVTQIHRGAADAPQWLSTGAVVAMVSPPEAEDVPPFSLVRLSPDGQSSDPIAQDVPRMFPQPPRLFQVVGESAIYPISTCDRGEAHLWSVGQPASARFTPAGVYAYRPALSPDAKSVAYVRVGDENALVVAPAPRGEPKVLLTTSLGLQVGTAGPWDAGDDWSPDGTWISVEVTTEQYKDCVPGPVPDTERAPSSEEPDGEAP
jgi:dipeptidyl aminopeptidase/acylaminoacyl peptidase